MKSAANVVQNDIQNDPYVGHFGAKTLVMGARETCKMTHYVGHFAVRAPSYTTFPNQNAPLCGAFYSAFTVFHDICKVKWPTMWVILLCQDRLSRHWELEMWKERINLRLVLIQTTFPFPNLASIDLPSNTIAFGIFDSSAKRIRRWTNAQMVFEHCWGRKEKLYIMDEGTSFLNPIIYSVKGGKIIKK